MKDYQTLFKEAEAKAAAVSQVEDQEEADRLLAEAEALFKKAETAKKAAELVTKAHEPQMPAPLPVDDGDGNTPEPELKATVKRDPVYAIRYGSPDSEVKTVLTDLHGPDYEGKRWAQWAAFNRYLRGGEQAMKSHDRGLLSEIILTPEYAEQAIKTGQDIAAVKTTMVEAQQDLGGYVVPVDWQANVIRALRGMVVMRGKARQANTSRDTFQWPKLTGDGDQYTSPVRMTWVSETPTAAAAATDFTFGQETIPIHEVMAETFLSRALVEDSAIDLPGLLAELFAEAAAIDEDNCFLTGDGNGRPQGLLPSSANALSLSEAESGVADALAWDGLIELIYEPRSQYRSRCVFIAEKATYKAIAKLKDSNGQYLWRDRFGNNVSESGEPGVRLMGYPTLEQEAMPTIAATAYPILFGDPSGYLIVDRLGMSIERYLDSATARVSQICYVMRRRLGGQCIETYKWAVQKCST